MLPAAPPFKFVEALPRVVRIVVCFRLALGSFLFSFWPGDKSFVGSPYLCSKHV